MRDAADSTGQFVPGVPDIVHPLGSLEFVMLPATGRYVPSSQWWPEVTLEGQDYRCAIMAPDGQIAATAAGSGHELPWVDLNPAGATFAAECARMPTIGSCVPGAELETVIQHLVAEELLSNWCHRRSARALVWASVEGAERGLWQAESGLSSMVAGDVAVLCDSRADAAWVWSGGTRVPAWQSDERLRHVERVDKRTWPTGLERLNDGGPLSARWA
ncbi:hypothetical protein AB0331_13780 [Dietzia maris]|uniref:hypothetical protein n=1 Tax=Dietzia maris TaxID=37915 RepID=UPI00344D3B4C